MNEDLSMVMAMAALMSFVDSEAIQAQMTRANQSFIPNVDSQYSLRTSFAATGIPTTAED
jgi:hypothetical protein